MSIKDVELNVLSLGRCTDCSVELRGEGAILGGNFYCIPCHTRKELSEQPN